MSVERFFRSLEFRMRQVSWSMIALGIFLAILASGLGVGGGQANSAAVIFTAPLMQGADAGAALFKTKCAGCHTIGGGKLVGPDLKDVVTLRGADWVRSFITDPAKMIASDPTAQALFKEYNNFTMPNLGLTPDEVNSLVEYLTNPGAAPASPAAPVTPGAQAAGAGDPAAGELLFTGAVPLTNGGSPCIACHSVSGTGALGGGSLGPNLTHVIQRLGEPAVAAALTTIAFPTMLGPYQNRPLTPQEQLDLVAFLRNADQWQAPVVAFAPGALTLNTGLVFGIALAGAVVLFGLLVIFWLRQKQHASLHLPERKSLSNNRRPS